MGEMCEHDGPAEHAREHVTLEKKGIGSRARRDRIKNKWYTQEHYCRGQQEPLTGPEAFPAPSSADAEDHKHRSCNKCDEDESEPSKLHRCITFEVGA